LFDRIAFVKYHLADYEPLLQDDLMRIVLDLLYILAGLCYSPVVLYRSVRFKRYRTGWGQRFGHISRPNPDKRCIWLHAVSVGEVNAAKTIVAGLEKRFSDFELVISTTTDTGFATAKNAFGAKHQVFFFPFDFSWVINRAFDNLKPAMCLLMELEVWPNFVDTALLRNIPVLVVNGRISKRSFANYMKIRPIAKKIFGKLSLVLPQTQEYAERFSRLGVPDKNINVTGSLKYDTAQVTDKVDGADSIADKIDIGTNLWVAGATGPGEEKIILDIFQRLRQQERFKELRLAIVPRKPERFDEVAQLLTDAGVDFIRYSTIKNAKPGTEKLKASVILGDTMGDLRKFYSLARIIFVGRSLVQMGGSDMIEAAALGKCTIFGPHTFNFTQAVDALIEGNGAIMVQDSEALFETVQKCLAEPDYAGSIAQNGRKIIEKNQGATEKTLTQISKFLSQAIK
jgi:3-deoxy-D-manno-octulosonic-acid transferase